MPASSTARDPGRWALDGVLILLAGGALAISALFRPESLPRLSLCPFHRFTGLPCPGCGLTRAFCCITHGEFADAWYFNPFGYLFYAGCLLLLCWPLIRRRWPEAETRLARSRWTDRLPLILIGSMMLFGIGRIVLVLRGATLP
jgi:hypothetical protein